PRRLGEHVARALLRPRPEGRVGLHDDDLEAGEPERDGVNAREAELEHTSRRLSEQLEDPRGRARGEGGRQSAHAETLTFVHRGAAKAAEKRPVEPDPGNSG